MKQITRRLLIIITVIIYCSVYVTAAKPETAEDGSLIIAELPAAAPYMEVSAEEFDLLCAVVDLEAGGEGRELQKAVTEVIINRLNSGLWGKTITEVVWSPNQFEVMAWIYKANPSELTKDTVRSVLQNGPEIPARVMFFRTGYYFSWARAEFNVGNVYFSSSSWYQR